MSKHQHGADDEAFRRAIGWQTPSPQLPDDYEEQLIERLFADGGPHVGDVSLHGLDELAPVSVGPLSASPLSASPLSARHRMSLREERMVREAVSPPPLVDTPPVSPKLSWHPSRRMTMVLAAAAAVALVGVHQLPSPPPQQTITRVALPAFTPPAPDAVRPLAPESPDDVERERLSRDEQVVDPRGEDEATSDQAPTPDVEVPEPMRDPGGRLARRSDETERARARTDLELPAELTPELPPGVASGITLAQFDRSRELESFARPGFGGDAMFMSDGFTGLGPATLRDFDPDADHAAVSASSVSASIVGDEIKLAPGVSSENDVGPALLRAATPPAQPVVANVAPHTIGPRWLGLGVSLPPDVQTSVPAGIRVVGAIDISKTHRQLQF